MPDDRPLASPVFVDPTGRRRRTVRRAAVAGAAVLIGTMALLVAALLGAPLGPLTPLPESDSGPAAVEPVAVPQQTPQGPQNPTTSSPTRPANNPAVGPGAVSSTTPPGSPTTTTTVTKGSKPEAPPGRPSGLPTPPGHTR